MRGGPIGPDLVTVRLIFRHYFILPISFATCRRYSNASRDGPVSGYGLYNKRNKME